MTEAVIRRHPFSQVLEHSLGMFVVTDTDGVAVYANEGSVRRTGYSIAETIGKKPGNLWGGRMSRDFYRHLWNTIRDGRPVIADLENKRKDGGVYAERIHIAPVMDDQRRTKFFIAAQPFHLDASTLDSFGTEFRYLFGRRDPMSGTRFIEWASRWFAANHTGISNIGQHLSLESFIKDELTSPLRERFSAREEDRMLIEAAQEDEQAFRHLYEKYVSSVKAYLFRHLDRDRDVAEDLTQETFFRAFSALSGFSARNASYGTYLLRIAHNLLVNHYRKKQPLVMSDASSIEERVAVSPARPVTMEHLFDEAVLSPAEKQVLILKYREGFSIREISTLFGISENAVKLRLSRARKRLGSSLKS